jgi:hypothetical protein
LKCRGKETDAIENPAHHGEGLGKRLGRGGHCTLARRKNPFLHHFLVLDVAVLFQLVQSKNRTQAFNKWLQAAKKKSVAILKKLDELPASEFIKETNGIFRI